MGKRASAASTAKAETPERKKRTGKGPEDADQKTAESDGSGVKLETDPKIKNEPAEREDLKKMISKMHYLKKTGKPAAYKHYQSLDVDGKRSWFWNVYKKDPSLDEWSKVEKSRKTFRSLLISFSNLFFSFGLSSPFHLHMNLLVITSNCCCILDW